MSLLLLLLLTAKHGLTLLLLLLLTADAGASDLSLLLPLLLLMAGAVA